MGNRVISYNLRGFEVFLKVPVIIIIRFGENNVLGTIMSIWGVDGEVHCFVYDS